MLAYLQNSLVHAENYSIMLNRTRTSIPLWQSDGVELILPNTFVTTWLLNTTTLSTFNYSTNEYVSVHNLNIRRNATVRGADSLLILMDVQRIYSGLYQAEVESTNLAVLLLTVHGKKFKIKIFGI